MSPNNLYVILAILVMTTSCKKDKTPQNSNELKATVVYSTGETFDFISTGEAVNMGCGIGAFVQGTMGKSSLSVTISISAAQFCLTSPGVYTTGLNMQFIRDVDSPTSPEYWINGHPGDKVTVTTLLSDKWEGSFSLVGYTNPGTDTVLITGTFRGNVIN